MANEELTSKIHMAFVKHKKRYGSPRITWELKRQGEKCGRNRVSRIMRKEGLVAKQKRRFRKTTDSNHNLPTAPNILAGTFECAVINTIWVSDITYIWTLEGWLYLCAILDLCSKQVVGWAMSDHIDGELVLSAFYRACEKRKPPPGVIFHSDKGIQYAFESFREALKRREMIQSMSRRGNPYDNAVSESFFNTLKTEEVYQRTYFTKQQARTCIFEYIEIYYNRVRLHSSLGYLPPVEFEWKIAA
jgi:transposase InsO family protein